MSITGLDFLSLQVRDLDAAAAFYENVVGLTRAGFSPPHAVVFATTPAFAVREAIPGVELEKAGVGAALWFHDPEVATLHASVVAAGGTVLQEPFKGPFGTTIVFADLDGYAITVHDKQ